MVGVMRDRLAEMDEKAQLHMEEPGYIASFAAGSFAELEASVRHGGFLREFFEEIGELRSSVGLLAEDVAAVLDLHAAILTDPTTADSDRAKLDELSLQIKRELQRRANRVRTQLKAMDNLIELDRSTMAEKNRERKSESCMPAELRIRDLQHKGVARAFVEVMTEYNRAQSVFRERSMTRIQRQLGLAGRSVEPAELEELLDAGGPGPAALLQGIVMDQTQEARETLADIEARHGDLLKLEGGLRELHGLFSDMAALVESQGRIVDSIERNVDMTRDWVEEGTRGLTEAQKMIRRRRRQQLVLLIISGSVIGLIMIFLVAWIRY